MTDLKDKLTDRDKDWLLAKQHWEFLESWLHKIFIDAWLHGAKHAREEKYEHPKG